MDLAARLRHLGFPIAYLGFPYLTRSVSLVLAEPAYLYQIFKRLYPDVAREFRTTPACVERDLRTLIRIYWSSGGADTLRRISPYPLTRRPTVSELLALLTGYFQDCTGL